MPKFKPNESTKGYKPKLGSHNKVSEGPFKRPLYFVDAKPVNVGGGKINPVPLMTEDYSAQEVVITETEEETKDTDKKDTDKKDTDTGKGDSLTQAKARRKRGRRKRRADRINKNLDKRGVAK